MEADVHSHILNEIERIEGYKKIAKNRLMIVCPFHDDNTPSCGIVIAEDGKYKLGSFNCLGCGEYGDWNKLADKVGLTPINNNMPQGGTAVTFGMKSKIAELTSEMLSGRESDVESMLEFLGSPATQPWPRMVEWRGYPGWLINNIGCLMGVGGKKLTRGDVFCYMPVVVKSKLVGFVRAFIEKVQGRESYLTSEGEWTKSHGLFPYSFSKLMIVKLKVRYVVLVEGPRDALRLIMAGIPAMAILGTQNMSKRKLNQLSSLLLDYVFIMPDNDAAGSKLKKSVRAICDKEDFSFTVKFLSLPKEKDDNGDLIKLDPDNMPRSILRDMKELLKDKYKCTTLKRSVLKDIKFNINKI